MNSMAGSEFVIASASTLTSSLSNDARPFVYSLECRWGSDGQVLSASSEIDLAVRGPLDVDRLPNLNLKNESPFPLAFEKEVVEVVAQREKRLKRLNVAVGCLRTGEPLPCSRRSGFVLGNANVEFASVGICEGRDCSCQLPWRNVRRFDIRKMALLNSEDQLTLVG
jgi:hypothetical protein